MKFSMRHLLMAFPWFACALMILRNSANEAYYERNYVHRPKVDDPYNVIVYAFIEGDLNRPCRITNRDLLDGGRGSFWVYEVALPVTSDDPNCTDQLIEDAVIPSPLAKAAWDHKYQEYLRKKYNLALDHQTESEASDDE